MDKKIFFFFKCFKSVIILQVTELNEKLDAEITRTDKLEIENKKLSSRATLLQRERDSLLQERDTLKETVEELKCSTTTIGINRHLNKTLPSIHLSLSISLNQLNSWV